MKRIWNQRIVARPSSSFLMIAFGLTACQDAPSVILPAAEEQSVEQDWGDLTENGMRAVIITDITGVATSEADVERMGTDEAERIVATYELGVLKGRLVALQAGNPQSGTSAAAEIESLNQHVSFYVEYLKQLDESLADETASTQILFPR